MNKEEVKENLIRAIVKLDNCWCHHQEGSDLIVDKSKLFSIVFNEVKPLLKDSLNKVVGEIKSKHYCSVCGLPSKPGGKCKECKDLWLEEYYNMEK